MKHTAFALATLITLSPLPVPPAAAQSAGGTPPDRAAVIKVAAGIMERARYCTLVTLATAATAGAHHGRVPAKGRWWSGWRRARARARSAKSEGPRVTLSYFDAKSTSYVTLIGRATLVSDPAEKAKRWKEAWAKLYIDGNRGDDYLLIRVTPIRLEVSARARA